MQRRGLFRLAILASVGMLVCLLSQIARSPVTVSRHWPTPSVSQSSPTRATNAPWLSASG